MLLDYYQWRQQTSRPQAQVNTSFSISTDELDQVAQHQGTSFRPGDILLIRTGMTCWHDSASPEEQAEALRKGNFIGVEASMRSVRWLWNHHFAAVAGDSLGFECCPAPFGVQGKVCLHEWLLVHWGTPIGELWNLEQLSKVCAERNQWTFFLTSAPLHVFGGVGTPPNAIAVL